MEVKPMPYTLPNDVDERPVVIDGAGTLGRRLAAVYIASGSDVRIFDPPRTHGKRLESTSTSRSR
jgi:3-hydroxyacyl-CoA dehydrogenase